MEKNNITEKTVFFKVDTNMSNINSQVSDDQLAHFEEDIKLCVKLNRCQIQMQPSTVSKKRDFVCVCGGVGGGGGGTTPMQNNFKFEPLPKAFNRDFKPKCLKGSTKDNVPVCCDWRDFFYFYEYTLLVSGVSKHEPTQSKGCLF